MRASVLNITKCRKDDGIVYKKGNLKCEPDLKKVWGNLVVLLFLMSIVGGFVILGKFFFSILIIFFAGHVFDLFFKYAEITMF